MNNENKKSKKHSNNINSISKVLQILRCFTITTPKLSAAKIARRIDLPVSTLYRYLQTLVDEGFLIHNREENTYSIGYYIIELAGISMTQFEFRRVAQREVTDLSMRLGLNTNLAVLFNGDTFHLAFSSRQPADPTYDILGRRTPAHLTAMGKVLLAELPFEEVRQNIERNGWRPRTPRSIQDFNTLQRELETIRQQGFGLDLWESSNACCVACPIRCKDGTVVAAISATTRVSSLENYLANLDSVLQAVFQTAASISYQIDYLGEAYMIRPRLLIKPQL